MTIASSVPTGGRLLIFLALIPLLSLDTRSADLPGSQDHPLIKRFGGSEIVGYDSKQFDAFELQTSTFLSNDLKTGKRTYARPPLKMEGSHLQIWYEAAGQTSSTELLRNYQNELKTHGFELLYDSTQDPQATNWTGFLSSLGEVKIATSRTHYVFSAADKKGIRVSSAQLKRPQGEIYVYLRAVEWGAPRDVYKARRGAYMAVDVVEVKSMVQNMVRVSAQEMSQAIQSSGKVALYGIFFDTAKAEIKPESKPALDEIAKLLSIDSKLKLHVVGHTDNVGEFDSNLALSKRRAEAVVAALVRDYGINASRLTPNGVAYLAPVAVNTTEEGRAKNRRVELVAK
ncbi:MAG: flagellar motor protein MotB [Acidobacteria bacterium]|nr:MAG: flagellar motor protein MotB [Acidobacteriota bacterium]